MPLPREKLSQQRSTSNPERARDAVLVRKPAARADVPDVQTAKGGQIRMPPRTAARMPMPRLHYLLLAPPTRSGDAWGCFSQKEARMVSLCQVAVASAQWAIILGGNFEPTGSLSHDAYVPR